MPVTAQLFGPTGAQLENESLSGLKSSLEGYKKAKDEAYRRTFENVWKLAEQTDGGIKGLFMKDVDGKLLRGLDPWIGKGFSQSFAKMINESPLSADQATALVKQAYVTGDMESIYKVLQKSVDDQKELVKYQEENKAKEEIAQAVPKVQPQTQPQTQPAAPVTSVLDQRVGDGAYTVGTQGVPGASAGNPLAPVPEGFQRGQGPTGSRTLRDVINNATALALLTTKARETYGSDVQKFLSGEFTAEELYALAEKYANPKDPKTGNPKPSAANYEAAKAAMDAADFLAKGEVSSNLKPFLNEKQKADVLRRKSGGTTPPAKDPAFEAAFEFAKKQNPNDPDLAKVTDMASLEKLFPKTMKRYRGQSTSTPSTTALVTAPAPTTEPVAVKTEKPITDEDRSRVLTKIRSDKAAFQEYQQIPVLDRPNYLDSLVRAERGEETPANIGQTTKQTPAEKKEEQKTMSDITATIRKGAYEVGWRGGADKTYAGDRAAQLMYAAQQMQAAIPDSAQQAEIFREMREAPLIARRKMLAEVREMESRAGLNDANAEYVRSGLKATASAVAAKRAEFKETLDLLEKSPGVLALNANLKAIGEDKRLSPEQRAEAQRQAIALAMRDSADVRQFNNVGNTLLSLMGVPVDFTEYVVKGNKGFLGIGATPDTVTIGLGFAGYNPAPAGGASTAQQLSPGIQLGTSYVNQ